jgi:DNA-directed RNA polymerase specialized sigma24 family protein
MFPSKRKSLETEQSLGSERAEAVHLVVKNLPEDLREEIVLCEWEDLNVAEAAMILEVTPMRPIHCR